MITNYKYYKNETYEKIENEIFINCDFYFCDFKNINNTFFFNCSIFKCNFTGMITESLLQSRIANCRFENVTIRKSLFTRLMDSNLYKTNLSLNTFECIDNSYFRECTFCNNETFKIKSSNFNHIETDVRDRTLIAYILAKYIGGNNKKDIIYDLLYRPKMCYEDFEDKYDLSIFLDQLAFKNITINDGLLKQGE